MHKLRNAIALLFLAPFCALGQSAEYPIIEEQEVMAKVVDSSRIEMSAELDRYLTIMDSIDAKTLKSNGYRIQVYSSSGPNARKDALQSQSDFLKIYRDYPSYTKWNYPNWVVRLGDYRTQLEAMEFHNEITTIFPASFIVRDEIKVE